MEATDQLRRAVQALAQPAHVQTELFPSFVAAGDELAIDFGEALERFVGSGAVKLTGHQSAALERLDAELARWSGPPHEELWLNRDLLTTDSRWDVIRLHAVAVLEAMGWPHERPGPSGAIYVPGSAQ